MLEITIHVKTPELADELRTLAGGLNIAHIPTMGITDDSIASAKTAPEQLALQTPAAPAAPVAPVMPAAPTAALVTPTAPTAEPDYTHEQLSSAAAAYLDKDAANMSKLQMLLGQLGVQAVTQLNTPVLRTAFANALRGLGAQL